MRKVMGPVSPGPTDRHGQWKPGQTGNAKGRPVHARNKLSHAFLTDMLEDWQLHGKAAIAAFRKEKPNEYVKVMAALIPREFNIKVHEYDELTDEQLDAQLAAVLAELAAAGADAGARGEAAAGAVPAGALPAVQ